MHPAATTRLEGGAMEGNSVSRDLPVRLSKVVAMGERGRRLLDNGGQEEKLISRLAT